MAFIRKSIVDGLGIKDFSDEEVKGFADKPERALYQYADMISRRAQSGWSTHGHSGADVNIYTSDKVGAQDLVGNHENTEVGQFLRKYLGVDVDAITKELREKGADLTVTDVNGEKVSWMGRQPEEGERLDGQTHLASYGGDFKKRRLLHGRDCGCEH